MEPRFENTDSHATQSNSSFTARRSERKGKERGRKEEIRKKEGRVKEGGRGGKEEGRVKTEKREIRGKK